MAERQTTTRSPSLVEEAMVFVMEQAIAWRLELALLVFPAALWFWVYTSGGPLGASLVVVLVMGILLAPPFTRRFLNHLLHQAHVRRHLDVAFASLSGVTGQRPPMVGRVTPTPAGDRVMIRLRHGSSVEDIERARPIIAASLGVREVRAVADPDRKTTVTLTIVRRDPFAKVGRASPLLSVEQFNAWDPIPVGVDEDGEVVKLSLPEHNVLFGAEPGGGKSVALSSLVAGCALDPTVSLWLFDGKLVELAAWRDCAERFCGPDLDLAISTLEDLRGLMDARYDELLDRRQRKVAPGEGWGLCVVVIDELALFVAGVDKKRATRFAELLRDLFGFRWALRCATREASDTVLGSGWAAAGYSAADIDPGRRGVGLLLHEGGVPVRTRSFGMSDDDVEEIALRAAWLRHGKGYKTNGELPR